MQLSFRKMHGAGNDFLVVDQREGGTGRAIGARRQSGKLSDRRLGVGFDQLMLIVPPA